MNPDSEIEKRLIELKPTLKREFKVDRIGLFGSYARGEETATSDLDILIELSEPLGWRFFDLKDFLENQFNREIDLVTRNALKKQLRDKILSQTKFI